MSIQMKPERSPRLGTIVHAAVPAESQPQPWQIKDRTDSPFAKLCVTGPMQFSCVRDDSEFLRIVFHKEQGQLVVLQLDADEHETQIATAKRCTDCDFGATAEALYGEEYLEVMIAP